MALSSISSTSSIQFLYPFFYPSIACIYHSTPRRRQSKQKYHEFCYKTSDGGMLGRNTPAPAAHRRRHRLPIDQKLRQTKLLA
jgi:hypothetical protein